FDAAQRRQILEELIKIDLEYRWRRRRRRKATERHLSTLHEKTKAAKRRSLPFRPHLEDYVRLFPELGGLADLPLDMILEEYRVRRRWGDKPEPEIYLARFAVRLLARLGLQLHLSALVETIAVDRV